MAAQETVHYRACNLCEAICGLEIHLDGDGQITQVRGDDADPFSQGHICPKGVAIQDIHSDPNRLRAPQLREGDQWRTIGWDEALDRAAAGLSKVREAHGNASIAVYLGNPNVHNLGSLLFGPPLLKALRTPYRYSATSADQLPHHVVAWQLFGHQLLIPVPDVDRTDYFLVLGANPAVSNGSLMTAPGMKRRLKAIRARGGKVVVIDPRRSETAQLADEHHFVRPAADALLLASIVHVLLRDGLVDTGHLTDHIDGIDRLQALVEPFSPAATAGSTRIDAATVERLAHEFAAAPSAVCYGRMGLSTQRHGALCQWLIQAINLLTGNLDRAGGAMFTTPAADILDTSSPGSLGRWHSRVRELPEFHGELPVATLAEDLLEPGEDRPRAMLTVAGNPVLSTPDGRRLDAALERLDFMVSVDFYRNETTRHAHLILPPTSPLEREHYDLVFNVLAVRNVARWSDPLYDKPADARHDWEIFHELLVRLDPKPTLRRRLERAARRRLGPRGMTAFLLRLGPYGRRRRRRSGDRQALSMRGLRSARHGLDLGPLEPRLPARLKTPNQRIDLAPELFAQGLGTLREEFEQATSDAAAPAGELLLIGRRQVRSNNSWMHNHRRLMRGADRCTLQVHADDALRAGLSDGDTARLSSRVGAVQVPVEVTDRLMPGVVSLPHGWGHGRAGIDLEIAAGSPGASLNDVTDADLVDTLCGNAAFSGVPVRIERAAAPANAKATAASRTAG